MFLASQFGIGKSIWHWQVNLALASQIGKPDWQAKLPFLYCLLLFEVHPFLFPLSSIAFL